MLPGLEPSALNGCSAVEFHLSFVLTCLKTFLLADVTLILGWGLTRIWKIKRFNSKSKKHFRNWWTTWSCLISGQHKLMKLCFCLFIKVEMLFIFNIKTWTLNCSSHLKPFRKDALTPFDVFVLFLKNKQRISIKAVYSVVGPAVTKTLSGCYTHIPLHLCLSWPNDEKNTSGWQLFCWFYLYSYHFRF